MKNLILAALLLSATPPPEEPHPVIILGGGIGGLTAAVYMGRAGLSPIVIEGKNPGGALAQSHSVQNWPGELDISGDRLAEKIHKQAEACGAKLFNEEVISVDLSSFPYTIETRNTFNHDKKRTLKAQSLIISMGTTPNFLGVPGEQKYWTRGVYNCATCDGPLYKNKRVVIVGGGDAAIVEANYLANLAQEVIILVRKRSFREGLEEVRKKEVLARPNVTVMYETEVKEIHGNEDELTKLIITTKGVEKELPTDALFLAIGSKPNTTLFSDRLSLDKEGYIDLKEGQESSIPGVYAVGDIVNNMCKQAVCAAGEAARASLQAEKWLSTKKEPSEPLK